MSVSKAGAAKSVFWSGLESGSSALISFVTLLIYVHLLTAAEFGLFAIILSLIELLAIIATMFFHDALIQREDITEKHYDTAFSATVGVSLILMALVCLLAGPLAQLIKAPQAETLLRVMSLYFPFSAFGMTIMARQRRAFRYKTVALRSLIGRLSGAAIGLCTAFLGWGVWSLAAHQLMIVFAGTAVVWLMADKRPKFGFGKREFLDLFHFGKYSIAALFLNFSIKRIFTVLSGISLGVVAAGYLNIAFRMLDVLWSLSATALQQVLLPMLSRLQNDPERLKRAYRFSVSVTCAVLYPCFVGIGLTSPEVISFFGEKWLPSAPYATALSFLILVQAPRLFVGPLLSALNRPQDTVLSSGAALLFLGAAALATGIPNLAWAVAIWIGCELANLPPSSILLRRQGISFRDQFAGIAMPLVAVLIMGGGVVLARSLLPADLTPTLRLAVLIPVGGVLYGAALWLLDHKLIRSLFDLVLSMLRRTPPSDAKVS